MWFLTSEKIEQIHNAALIILERTGFKVENAHALVALANAGCDVDSEKQIAKIPRTVVQECLQRSPKRFTIAGRNPHRDIELGAGQTFVRNQTGFSQFIDLENGEVRMGTRTDLINFTRVLDALPNIDFCGCGLYPSDEPSKVRDVAMLEVMIENTDKHILTNGPDTIQSLKWIIKIAKSVAGGIEELRRRPIITMFVPTMSPLRFDARSVAVALESGKHGIPVSFYPHCISGATGPVTLAGQIALTHAEMLGCITTCQSVNPGAPVICAPRPCPMNMRTGITLLGAIEFALLMSGLVQLGHFIGLPTDVHGCDTESKTLDMQSGIERTYGTIIPYLAGTDILSGAGALESCKTASIEQLAIDDEIYSIVKRMTKGIEITHETLAIDLIDKVGVGGHYLSETHTRKFFRQEHLLLDLFDRETRSVWEASGKKDIVQRAREKALAIIRDHRPAPLEKGIQKELDTLMRQARKDLGA